MYYSGVKNTGYTLSDQPFGIPGGEGTIYAIIGDDTRLAKIYHGNLKSFDSENTRKEKIKQLINMPQSENCKYLAWPEDALVDINGNICGFVMKKFEDVKELATIVSDNLNWKLRLTIAYNLCDVVQEVHDIAQCIGDMQPKNFGVNLSNGHVCAFDVDSFHLHLSNGQLFPCYVGLAEYYPPELQSMIRRGENMRTLNPETTFSQKTDLFSLAILIFMLLFKGFHPYRGQYISKIESSSLVTNAMSDILNNRSPYFNTTNNCIVNHKSPNLDIIPESMQIMFKKAFFGDPDERPTASEWKRELRTIINELKCCRNGRFYYQNLKECPWCKLEKNKDDDVQIDYNSNIDKKEKIKNKKTKTQNNLILKIFLIVAFLMHLSILTIAIADDLFIYAYLHRGCGFLVLFIAQAIILLCCLIILIITSKGKKENNKEIYS